MAEHARPITVRDVQEAMARTGNGRPIEREHIVQTLDISERQLDLLIAERLALDLSAHAYLAEFDLDDDA